MDEEFEISVSATVKQLKAAGTNLSKQVPALRNLGECYLKIAQKTCNGADFTKANCLYNAALVRCRSVNHEIGEYQILQGIVKTYRKFLDAVAKDKDEISVNKIQYEIDSHKQWIARERRILKERVDEIYFCFNTDNKSYKTDKEYEIHAEKMYQVFRDIQDMYIRLVSMLAKECESILGKPPCDYAIIALGPVARMEATPFSDLEFAVLYSDPTIGDRISYFQVLTHFLHLKVINLGETILPALGIKELNDFQSSDPIDGNWFYDSETSRGISFDGAMPWASKTPLGRMATKNKPALELIRTPKTMAELQSEEIAVKEGYHLADIMSRAALLYGDRVLLDEYNEYVAEKLNTKSKSVAEAKSTKTIGFIRGMQVMMLDVETYNPKNSYLGEYGYIGALFDAKKQFYRLISLLLLDLGLIFDVRFPSPWQVISELQTRGIVPESESVKIKVCLSIANEIRLKTYFANNGQKELFSPVPQNANTTKESADVPIFRDFNEDMLVRLLVTSDDMCSRCREFCLKFIQQGNIDIGLFQKPSLGFSKAMRLGYLYLRLQNLQKALKWMESESKDSLNSFHGKGFVHFECQKYEKSVECFEEALQLHYKNEEKSNLDVVKCINGLAVALMHMGKNKLAISKLEEAIRKHSEIYREGSQTMALMSLLLNLGFGYRNIGDVSQAVETFKKVQELEKGLTNVPDQEMIHINLNMAVSLSDLGEHAQSLEYLERALRRSHIVFGEHTISSRLAHIYEVVASVYCRCNLDTEAVYFFKRSLNLFHLVFGDKPHPGKIRVHKKLGKFFNQNGQTSEALKNLENALEQAEHVYHEKPDIIVSEILNELGMALIKNSPQKSLQCFQRAKEVMEEISGGPNQPAHAHSVTSLILYNIGTHYYHRGDFKNAFTFFKDALDIRESCGENRIIDGITWDHMGSLCSNFASTAEKMKDYRLAGENFAKAVKIYRQMSLTKMSYRRNVVVNLYRLSGICEILKEQEEALKHLEDAREIAKDAGFKHWILVDILVGLTNKYAEMGYMIKSMVCYVEAGEIATSLPKHDSLPPSESNMLKLMKI